jgi:hypothetical protein
MLEVGPLRRACSFPAAPAEARSFPRWGVARFPPPALGKSGETSTFGRRMVGEYSAAGL